MTSYNAVPELSLKDYADPDKQAAFSKDLFAGLKYYGFIILRDHGISEELLETAYALSAAFFAQDEETKRRYTDESVHCQRGYVPFGREHAKGNIYPDLKEMWHQGREVSAEHPQAATYPKNIHADKPEGFSDTVKALYRALDTAGDIVLKALAPELGLPCDYFVNMAKGGNSLLRLLHYPPLADDVDPNCVRAAAHEDINFMTMLVAASSAGLELLDRDGTWLPVNGSPNAIIVDAGDMLARITNNVIPATTHRVVNPTGPNLPRYSMPFFIHPKSDAMLSCIESCRDGTEMPDILADDFLQERLREIGLSKAS